MKPPAEIAGRYGPKTNLFQFALVMWAFITMRMPPGGLHYLGVKFNDLPDKVPSFGWHLLMPQYKHVDRELRALVVRCLCANPDHRPDLDYLQRICEKKVQSAEDKWPPEESDEKTRAWCNQAFTNPPREGLRPLQGLQDVGPSSTQHMSLKSLQAISLPPSG